MRTSQQSLLLPASSTSRVAVPGADLIDRSFDDADSTAYLRTQRDPLAYARAVCNTVRGMVASNAPNGQRSRENGGMARQNSTCSAVSRVNFNSFGCIRLGRTARHCAPLELLAGSACSGCVVCAQHSRKHIGTNNPRVRLNALTQPHGNRGQLCSAGCRF